MELNRLLEGIELNKLIRKNHAEIRCITTDITSKKKDSLLILIKSVDISKNRDLLEGFAAIMCEEESFEHLSGLSATLISVKNVRKSWALAASRFHEIDYSRLSLIAVTGTNGKTTTATMLTRILEHAGHRVGFIGTGKIYMGAQMFSDQSYSMTTPDPTLLYATVKKMQDLGADTVVMEVSSHALYFDKTAAMTFDLSVFTNISPEHLDFHKSISEYLNTKLKLLQISKKVIFNVDDPLLRPVAEKCRLPKATAGILWRGDAYVTDIDEGSMHSTSFIYKAVDHSFRVRLPLPCKYNVYNALLAISAAEELGVLPRIAKLALESLERVEGRFEIVHEGDFTVIIDYAHTEVAFELLLRSLRNFANKKSLRVLFGCGGERYREKRPAMAKIAEKYADAIYVTSDNSRNESQNRIFDDIRSGFGEKASFKLIEDRKTAIETAINEASRGDIIALVGKGAEKYNIDVNGYHCFDERSIVKDAIKKRGTDKDASNS